MIFDLIVISALYLSAGLCLYCSTQDPFPTELLKEVLWWPYRVFKMIFKPKK